MGGYVLGPVGVFLRYAGHKGSCAGEKNCVWFHRPPGCLHWKNFRLFLWILGVFRWIFGVPVAALVGFPSLWIAKYSCNSPSAPKGSYVVLWLPGCGFPASRLPGIFIDPRGCSCRFLPIPLAARVRFPGLRVAGYSCRAPGVATGSCMFLWLPGWVSPASELPGIHRNPPVFL